MVQTHKLFTCVCISVNDSLEAVLLMALSFMPFLRKAVLIARSFVFAIRLLWNMNIRKYIAITL